MIKCKCGNCDHRIGAPDKYAGKRIRCPKCQNPIHVPQAAEKTPAQQTDTIKFRCPKCNQKIGLSLEYAGKKVRCAKCQSPLKVPTPSTQIQPAKKQDPTAVLRAGNEQPLDDNGLFDDLPDMEQLSLAEENAPSLEQQIHPAQPDHQQPDSQPEAFPTEPITAEIPKKKRTAIFVVAGCAVLLLAAVIFIWNLIPDSLDTQTEIDTDFYTAKEFAQNYIDLLTEKKIEQAKKLFTPELQADIQNEHIEELAEMIDTDQIIKYECKNTHYDEFSQEPQILLLYKLTYNDNSIQQVIISLMPHEDDNFTVNSIAAQRDFGDAISIGPSTYEDLIAMIVVSNIAKFAPLIAKFFGIFFLIALALIILHIVSMWIVFNKAGQPGWAAIVPYYNMWVLAEVADKPGWMGILFCFSGAIPMVGPIVSFILWVVISIGVARAFGHGIGFAIGLTVLPFIFFPILAFSSANT